MNYPMIQTMRWYGPDDAVSLQDIRQAGCAGVVTALHQIPVGEIWSDDAIRERKTLIENAGMKWSVVESLPVHEDIKKRSGNFRKWIVNYKTSLRNLANHDVRVVTYNFMPVLDWLRTDLSYATETGALALRFEWLAFVCFDLFILKRPNAENDYDATTKEKAANHYQKLTESEKTALASACLQGLPGSTRRFSSEEILALLAEYKNIDEKKLQENLFRFLNEIAPVAEEAGVQLAIHPDDPPFPVLGLPRIMSTADHARAMISAVPSKTAGFCFCTGAFGARKDNDLPRMLKEFGERVYFLHLRSTQNDGEGNFYEANHLEGDADLLTIVQVALALQNKEQRAIPMRPDHGHQMLDDLNKRTFAGYSAIGRLKGLAELRGLEIALIRMMELEKSARA